MNLDSTIDSDSSCSSSGRRRRLITSGRVLEGSKTDRFGELPSGIGLDLLGRPICLVIWGPGSRSC